jgi:hypothetical protein
MALYTPREATLGDFKGKGYTFVQDTIRGHRRGVFFGSEEDAGDLESLLSQERVRFEGVVYKRNRSGKVTKKMQAFLVEVKNLLRVHAGERVTFEVIEEA